MTDYRAFPPKLRVLSFTPRWSILPTIRPDYTASHSYFVAVYARQIAKLIEWKGPMGVLLWHALIHDADEMVTGDIVGVVKRAVVDSDKLKAYVDDVLQERAPDFAGDGVSADLAREVHLITKAADQLDALFYILGEAALGNQVMATRAALQIQWLLGAWRQLPATEDAIASTWRNVVTPAIEAHRNPEEWSI